MCPATQMQFFTVALLQMTGAGFDQAANLAKGEAFCRQAKAQGAEVALFPEMWNIGYRFFDPAQPETRRVWQQQALDAESTFVRHFCARARELQMAMALTYLERWPGAPRNTAALINRQGEIVLTYAKMHTCDFDVEAALTPGADFYVADLETETGPVKVGLMICFDREFPESARLLMLKGAEIILVPNACELEQHRLEQLRTRACENMTGVAVANYAAPQENGHSAAYDGIAFDDQGRSRDMHRIEAGEGEGVYLAQFDLDRLRAYQAQEAWGNAYRKPSRYGLLTAPAVEPPFVRPNARR